MPIEENVQYIDDLVKEWPTPNDPKQRGDDHLRNLKKAVKQSFPMIAGPVPIAHDQFVSKTDLEQAQFSSALPAPPAGNLLYRLTTQDGATGWTLDGTFVNKARLAEAYAISLSI